MDTTVAPVTVENAPQAEQKPMVYTIGWSPEKFAQTNMLTGDPRSLENTRYFKAAQKTAFEASIAQKKLVSIKRSAKFNAKLGIWEDAVTGTYVGGKADYDLASQAAEKSKAQSEKRVAAQFGALLELKK